MLGNKIKELCSFLKNNSVNPAANFTTSPSLEDFHDDQVENFEEGPAQMEVKHLMDKIKSQAKEIQRLQTEMRNLIEIQNQKAKALEVANQDRSELEKQLAEKQPLMMRNIMLQDENKLMAQQNYSNQQSKPDTAHFQNKEKPLFLENSTILHAFLDKKQDGLNDLVKTIQTTAQSYDKSDLKHYFGMVGSNLFQKIHLYMQLNKVFERLSDDSGTDNFTSTFETQIRNLMDSRRIILWAHVVSAHVFVSRSASLIVPEGEGLLGKAINEGKRIIITDPTRDRSYSINYDAPLVSNARISLYQPVIDDKGETIWIIQIIDRLSSKGNIITPTDEDFLILDFLSKTLIKLFDEENKIDEKIKQILTESTRSLLTERQVMPLLETVQMTVTCIVGCESLQIFFTDPSTNTLFELKEGSSGSNLSSVHRVNLAIKDAGIAGVAFKKKKVINVAVAKEHEGYKQTVDGQFPNGAVIAVPLLLKGVVSLVAVARQKKKGMMFTESDEIILEALSRVSQGALTNAQNHERNIAEIQKARNNHKYYMALLTVAQELSAVLDTDTLVRKIMTKAQSFIGADRCSLFLVDKVRGGLWSMVAHGATGKIHIPKGQGIAAHVAETGETLNIPDAYEDPRFNSAVDKSTGYRTRSILCVAIHNGSGGIIGCTQMINKLGAPEFSKTDCELMTAFNVFCGIALSNAQLFEAATQSKKKMTAMLDIALSLSTSMTLESLVTNIMQRANELIEAEHCTLFIHDWNHQVCRPLDANSNDDNKRQFSLKRDAVGYVTVTGTELNSSDPKNDRRFDMYYADNVMKIEAKSMLSTPVIDASGQIVGVVQAINKKGMPKFTEEDQSLLRAFASFAGLALEQWMSKLPEVFGNTEEELIQQLEENELESVEPGEKLKIVEPLVGLVNSNKFEAIDYSKNDQFRVLIHFFDKFDLLTTYQVSLRTLMNFLGAVYNEYHHIPFHNFNFAVDATQFVFFELMQGDLASCFNKLELLVLLISCICHDMGHTGRLSSLNEKAQSPLNILYKEQPVMETFHCSALINIMAIPKNNIIAEMDDEHQTNFWTYVFDCILATDMGQHKKIIEEAEAKLNNSNGSFDLKNPQNKQLLLKLLVKCAVHSGVARVFDPKQSWSCYLSEEAFPEVSHYSGDTVVSAKDNDVLVAKCQIEYVQNYCVPLFTILGRMMPELQTLGNQVRINLAKWKEISNDNEDKNKK